MNQKIKNNETSVGADFRVRPYYKGILKTQKGITLIALLVTIIVMLILLGVTITSALKGGLFKTTQKAVNEHAIAQDKEIIMQTFLEWQFEDGKMSDYFAKEYGTDKVQANADGSITLIMPSGNRYVVTKDGKTTLLDGTVEELEPLVIKLTLDKTSITKEIESGSTATESLTATLENAEGTLNWISSDNTVAEISGTGNTRTITLKKVGTATITVNYGEYKAECSVTVTEKIIPVTSITISGETTVNVGETTQLTVAVLPANASNKEITWSSKNTGVATVDSTGKVTGVSAGTATIVATSNNNIKDEYTIVVIEVVEDPLAGTWVFNDELKFTEEFSYDVNFITESGNVCSGIKSYIYDAGLDQWWMLDFYVEYVNGPTWDCRWEDSWMWDSDSVITIKSNLSDVDGGVNFLAWLQANATKQSS